MIQAHYCIAMACLDPRASDSAAATVDVSGTQAQSSPSTHAAAVMSAAVSAPSQDATATPCASELGCSLRRVGFLSMDIQMKLQELVQDRDAAIASYRLKRGD